MNAPCPLQHYFEIIIEDSGIGIDPAEIGRILSVSIKSVTATITLM